MIVSGGDFASYRFRYLGVDGAFSRVAEAVCASDSEAVRKAAVENDDYAALEITCGDRLVWCGLREDVPEAAAAG